MAVPAWFCPWVSQLSTLLPLFNYQLLFVCVCLHTCILICSVCYVPVQKCVGWEMCIKCFTFFKLYIYSVSADRCAGPCFLGLWRFSTSPVEMNTGVFCVCVWTWFTEVWTVCLVCVCLCVVLEMAVHPLVKERDRQQLWRLCLVTEAEPLTRPQRHVCGNVCLCVYFRVWDGPTGHCEKYDCMSGVDCRSRRVETAQSCPRCFISPQQSVMQVEQTRWPGKDLYNTARCSQMIVLFVCVHPVVTRKFTHPFMSEDNNLCCAPEQVSACVLWIVTWSAPVSTDTCI